MKVYNDSTRPLLEYYGKAGLLSQVDGIGRPEEIFHRILAKLGGGAKAGSRANDHAQDPDELAIMRKASTIVAEILEELAAAVRPGITTFDLDKMAEELTYKKGAKPAFKGYQPGDVPYPKTLCVSVNEEIVHGIPSSRKLKQGDIVGLDFGVVYERFLR